MTRSLKVAGQGETDVEMLSLSMRHVNLKIPTVPIDLIITPVAADPSKECYEPQIVFYEVPISDQLKPDQDYLMAGPDYLKEAATRASTRFVSKKTSQ